MRTIWNWLSFRKSPVLNSSLRAEDPGVLAVGSLVGERRGEFVVCCSANQK